MVTSTETVVTEPGATRLEAVGSLGLPATLSQLDLVGLFILQPVVEEYSVVPLGQIMSPPSLM